MRKKQDIKEEKNAEENSVPIEEIKLKKKRRNKKYILFYIAGFAFIVYASFTIISQGIEINHKRAELNELREQVEVIEIDNDYLEKVSNLSGKEREEYIENIAREDYDYVKNGERVFVNISGD